MESKVFKLLNTFSKKEWKDFEIFLNSDISHSSENCKKFFAMLKKEKKDFDESKFHENAEKVLFGRKKTASVNYRGLLSDLNQLAERFILFQKINKNDFFSQYILSRELSNRNLHDHFMSHYIKFNETNEKSLVSSETLLLHHLMFDLHWENEQKVLISKMHKLSKQMNVEETLTRLLDYFQAQFILNFYSVSEHNRIHNLNLNIDQFQNLTDYLTQNFKSENPLILILHFLNKFLKNKNHETASEFSAVLKGNWNKLNKSVLQSIFPHLVNYYAREVSRGEGIVVKETFELFHLASQNQTIFFNDKIQNSFFINYIQIALLYGKIEEADLFITKHEKYLEKDHRASTIAYTNALIDYERKQLNASLKNLLNAEFDTPVRQIGIKNLYLKIYYDKEEYEAAFNIIDSYRHILKNAERLPFEVREIHSNFLRFYQKLWQVRLKKSDKKVQSLKNEIELCQFVSNKNWLISKIH